MDRNTLLLDRRRKEWDILHNLVIVLVSCIYLLAPFQQCHSLWFTFGVSKPPFLVKICSTGWSQMYLRVDVMPVSPIPSILAAMPLQVRLEASHPSDSSPHPFKPRLKPSNHAVQLCGPVLNRKDTTSHLTKYLSKSLVNNAWRAPDKEAKSTSPTWARVYTVKTCALQHQQPLLVQTYFPLLSWLY